MTYYPHGSKKRPFIDFLYQFLRTAPTNYCKLDCLKWEKLILLHLMRQEAQTQGADRMLYRKVVHCLFQLLVAPRCSLAYVSVTLISASIFMWLPSPCLSIGFFLLIMKRPVNGFRAPFESRIISS